MADLVITPANVIAGAGKTTTTGIAGATITAGQALYADATTSPAGKLKPADADLSSAAATVVGVALHAASLDQPITYQTAGQLAIGATTVAGKHYFASPTAGGIAPSEDLSTGEYASRVGYAISTSVIVVDIKNTGVITA